jgi:L-threonine kinase
MATLEFLGEPAVDAELWLDSRIPRGKGMASSTADVSAAIVATAGALSQEMSPEQIAEIALGIEPSDGVMFPKIVIFDHLQGRTARPLGSPPPMRVAVLDFGGEVDTLEFNNTERENALRCLQTKMTEAASLIERGIREKDYLLVGRGATISSFANQEILFKPHLDAVIEFANEVGAAGVNVAHSGTVIGLLFPDNAVLVERAVAVAPHRLDRLESVMQCRVTGGGVWRL